MPHCPVVATRHFAAVRGRSHAGRLVRPLLRWRIDAQIAISHFVAGSIDGDSRVVYAGVESQPPVESTRLPLVLVAQRLETEKRTADAVEAFGQSGLAEQGWRLQVAGRGSEEAALRARTDQLGLARAVDFLGFCGDLPRRMREAGMVLATAPAEPFGLTVVEAMAHGAPVVASASGGHLESVGRAQKDFMFAPGDLHEAADRLARLAGDPEARIGYGAALRTVQQELFTTERQFRETQSVYDELCGR